MTYDNLTLAEIIGLIDKLGGEEGVHRFLRGETIVADVRDSFLLNTDSLPAPQNFEHDILYEVIEHLGEGYVPFSVSGMQLVSMKLRSEVGRTSISVETARERSREWTRDSQTEKPVHYPNAVLRDFLLQHQHLIPQKWGDRDTHSRILFLGTLLKGQREYDLFVPTMVYNPNDGLWYADVQHIHCLLDWNHRVLRHYKATAFTADPHGRMLMHKKHK